MWGGQITEAPLCRSRAEAESCRLEGCWAPRPLGRKETWWQGTGPGRWKDSAFTWDLQLLMEKEPQDTLCTPTRQQTIRIISSLW